MDRAMEQVFQFVPVAVAIVFVGASYLIITLDRQRANSPSKDDTQVGIKLVLWGLLIAALFMAANGVQGFLAFALGGFKGGSIGVRLALPPILVGGATAAIVAKVLLPRTNNATMKQVERYALGLVGLYFAGQALYGINQVLTGVLAEAPWAMTSSGLATTLVSGAIGFLAIAWLGAKSGWTGIAPHMPGPPPGYPPQGGQGYPPQGGQGYPPQGGGYPPQGGGYPPQGGGGYAPQGGSGGYPPQGGGGGGGGGGYPPPP